jgi:RNA polymerase sigma-54 factor
MKQSLQLRVSQQLTLTPQLQQSIKLLQLSTLDLQTEVERFLLDNPMLERGDDLPAQEGPATESASSNEESTTPASDSSDGDSQDESSGELTDWGSGSRRNDGDDEFDPMLNVPCPVSLREHLLAQLGELTLPTRDQAIVQLLIEELDDNGFSPSTWKNWPAICRWNWSWKATN